MFGVMTYDLVLFIQHCVAKVGIQRRDIRHARSVAASAQHGAFSEHSGYTVFIKGSAKVKVFLSTYRLFLPFTFFVGTGEGGVRYPWSNLLGANM